MRPRDLFRLPFGNYVLTDGIYKFMLKKLPREWGNRMPYYSISEYGSLFGGSANFYEETDDVFDDSSIYKQKVLTGTVFITGMSFSIGDCWRQILRLTFVPRSSYKEWLKNIEDENHSSIYSSVSIN